jgi:hypothetical protein
MEIWKREKVRRLELMLWKWSARMHVVGLVGQATICGTYFSAVTYHTPNFLHRVIFNFEITVGSKNTAYTSPVMLNVL